MALIWLCVALVLLAVLVFVWALCAAASGAAEEWPEETPSTTAFGGGPPPSEREAEAEAYYIYPGVPLTDEFQRYLQGIARERDVPPALVLAIIARESDFDPGLIGDDGQALGLMQIQPFWHHERMEALGVLDLLDPAQNIRVGIDFLAELMAEGRGIEWAVMAYNGGYDHADYFTERGELSRYATDVMRMFECIGAAGIPAEG